MVVMPFTVVETSLTMVLAELPPPPDPELPLADCEDEVSALDDVADVDSVPEDDVVALDGDVVTAALVEAIALIDMRTSPEGHLGAAMCAPDHLIQRGRRRIRAAELPGRMAARAPHISRPREPARSR